MTYWVTWFPGVLLASFGVLAMLWKGFRTFAKVYDAVPTLLKAAGELEHNGGSTVKDDISHIKREQTRVARELATSNQRTDARLVRVEAKLGIGEP